MSQTGTDTLRMSSQNPNSQQISKKEVECKKCKGEGCRKCKFTGKNLRSLRWIFGPLPGREWWSLDYENIELRIPAYESGEGAMIELFERPDDPPFYGSNHLLNMSIVYADLWEALGAEVGSDRAGPEFKKRYKASWYQFGKNGGFCKQYGGGKRKTDLTFRRAGAYDLLDRHLSRMARLNREQIEFAKRHGYVETIPDRTLGFSRGYPLLVSRTDWGGVLTTVPLNYHVQGTAMWCTRRAMVRCDRQLSDWNRKGSWYGRMVLQVHDEIDFDFPKADPRNRDRVLKLRELMEESGGDIGVPLKVSVSYHPEDWATEERLPWASVT